MANGGPRPGAGRPKGSKSKSTQEKEAARELVRQLVTRKLRPLIKAQIANALGVKYLVVRDKKSGKFLRVGQALAKLKVTSDEDVLEVWEKDPSVYAFTDLLNRAIDKPKEQEIDVNINDADSLLARLQGARKRTGDPG